MFRLNEMPVEILVIFLEMCLKESDRMFLKQKFERNFTTNVEMASPRHLMIHFCVIQHRDRREHRQKTVIALATIDTWNHFDGPGAVWNLFRAYDLSQYTRNFNKEQMEFGRLHQLAEEDPSQLYQSLVIELGVLPRDLAKFKLLLSFVVTMPKPLSV